MKDLKGKGLSPNSSVLGAIPISLSLSLFLHPESIATGNGAWVTI